MNSAELTALHTETINEARRQKNLENITRRAVRLFDIGSGYNATQTMSGLYVQMFRVTSPEGKTYTVKLSKTNAAPGSFYGSRCDCPAFAEYGTCKHLEALVMQAAQEQAQCDEHDALYENSDDDRYAEF